MKEKYKNDIRILKHRSLTYALHINYIKSAVLKCMMSSLVSRRYDSISMVK